MSVGASASGLLVSINDDQVKRAILAISVRRCETWTFSPGTKADKASAKNWGKFNRPYVLSVEFDLRLANQLPMDFRSKARVVLALSSIPCPWVAFTLICRLTYNDISMFSQSWWCDLNWAEVCWSIQYLQTQRRLDTMQNLSPWNVNMGLNLTAPLELFGLLHIIQGQRISTLNQLSLELLSSGIHSPNEGVNLCPWSGIACHQHSQFDITRGSWKSWMLLQTVIHCTFWHGR